MTTTREQAANALLAQIDALPQFKTVSRRLIEPTQVTVDQSPSLFLLEAGEAIYNMAPQTPPRRTLKYIAIVYNNVGGDDLTLVPASALNDALDALDAMLRAQSDPVKQRVTLGGLVYHVRIEGDVVKAPGETTGLAMAVVPFEIVLP